MESAVILSAQDYKQLMERFDRMDQRIQILEETAINEVTVKQAKVLLKVSKGTIYNLIERGELKKSQDGGSITISMKSIREYKEKYRVAA